MDTSVIVAAVAGLMVGFIVGRTSGRTEKPRVVWAEPGPPLAPGAHGEQLEALIRDGRKIEAIKLHRETHRSGLKEAKDAVEALEAEMKRRH